MVSKVVFGELKEFRQVYALPPIGNFALDVDPPKEPKWQHCREQFAPQFNRDVKGFYYSTNNCEDVAEFVVKCEEIIGIGEHSSFSKTEKDIVLWVIPSSFWVNCEMKRSFLTMILRCGLNYNREKDNFDDALFSEQFSENKWARETKLATMRFLFGFTYWTGEQPYFSFLNTNKHGWHEEFQNLDIFTVKKRLVSLDKPRESNIGFDTLWE